MINPIDLIDKTIKMRALQVMALKIKREMKILRDTADKIPNTSSYSKILEQIDFIQKEYMNKINDSIHRIDEVENILPEDLLKELEIEIVNAVGRLIGNISSDINEPAELRKINE